MYCWNCGKEMEDELLFCPHCAMKQAGIPEPRPRRKILVLPIACAAVCLCALMGMFLLLGGNTVAPGPVDPYSVELPDPVAFLNTPSTREDVSEYTHYVSIILNRNNGMDAVQEFVSLLQEKRYQLTMDDSWDYIRDQALCTDYIFRYTGKNEAIRWVNHKDGYRYHVKLSVYEHTKNNQITLIFYTEPDFLLEDPGVDAKAVK